MALDAGTGSCRSIIFTAEGTEAGFGFREWYHPTIPQVPGSQTFETKRNWKLICESIRDSLANSKVSPDEIASVSATSMRYGSVLYDQEGNEIWAAPNMDARAEEQVREAIEKGYFNKFYRITGDGPTLCDLMRWLWVRRYNPKVWKKVKHFTLISDWIIYKLTGRFVTDPSIANSSGLLDVSKRIWSEEIAELYSIPLELAPEIHQPGTVVGEVTSKASEETGLSKGTPVVISGGDTMAALIGTGGIEKGVSTIIGGSMWQQTYLWDKPIFDPQTRVRLSPHIMSDLWMLETNSVFPGLTMRWFRDAFCEEEKEKAKMMGVDPYYLMEKLASKAPPGSNGLIAIFSDLFNTRRWIHAAPAFIQFDVTSPEKFGKGEFIRRIEEDAALQSFGNLNIIWEVVGFKPNDDYSITFCGGASKGFLWPQIISDVMGVKVKVPKIKEATGLGAAICAGVGAGIYSSIYKAAKELVRVERMYRPDLKNHELYMALYSQWRKVYQYCLEMVDKGITKPMWKAAGT
jgi:autoinducer 2 (AI-2) kinase